MLHFNYFFVGMRGSLELDGFIQEHSYDGEDGEEGYPCRDVESVGQGGV